MLSEGTSGVSHSLDVNAAAVWRACDGARDRADIAHFTGLSQLQVAVIVDRLVSLGLTDGLTIATADVVDLASRREQTTEPVAARSAGARALRLV